MINKTLCYNFLKKKRLRSIDKQLSSLSDEHNNIIVSLTSYKERLNIVHHSIQSIMDQSLKPDCVVLYLSESKKEVQKYTDLLKLQDHGLRIIFDCPNILGHKKYFWAMQDFDNSVIITIDDDVIYPRYCIESLFRMHRRYPYSVVARRVNNITYQDGHLLPYNQWHYNYRSFFSRPLNSLLATGVGGVLYPPHIFSQITYDLSLIKDYALKADDIWLKVCEILCGIKVTWAPCIFPHPYPLEDTVNSGLADYNVINGNNDIVLNNLLHHFNLSTYIFQD